ncbi:hypothetical protein TRVL_04235 [Trypanosoma vivax]|nr:hypothetical protein TRVL_04235 [Trypanosoma vivax]
MSHFRRSADSTSYSTAITTDTIKKICVQTGFYRNPVCNEKLYLHNKSFDSIDEDAFDPYTNVKVLWLEGNALTTIPCGRNSLPCKVKKAHTELLGTVNGEENKCKERCEEEGQCVVKIPMDISNVRNGTSKRVHLDCYANWVEATCESVHAADNREISGRSESCEEPVEASASVGSAVEEQGSAPCLSARVKEGCKDVFQSLYPTLRQLYLHNNAMKRMPDLSGFQCLDAVNLSNNCLRFVESYCVVFEAEVAKHQRTLAEKAEALISNSKSMQRELSEVSAQGPACGASKSDSRLVAEGEVPEMEKVEESTLVNGVGSVDAAERKSAVKDPSAERSVFVTAAATESTRKDELEVWRELIETYSHFCPHSPYEPPEGTSGSENIPEEFRNPCSTVRTLNLANNYISSVADMVQLLCFKNVSVLDLSNNQLSDGEAVLFVLEKLPRLRALKLSGNPLVRTLPRYRKTVLLRCGGLLHLDDRPVFDNERRLVTAWGRGGDEEEKRERQLIKDEEKEALTRRLEEFRAMISRTARSRTRSGGSDGPMDAGGNRDTNLGVPAQVPVQRNQEENSRIASHLGMHQRDSGNIGGDADNDERTSSDSDVEDHYNEHTRDWLAPAVARGRRTVSQATAAEARVSSYNENKSEDEDDIYVPPSNH